MQIRGRPISQKCVAKGRLADQRRFTGRLPSRAYRARIQRLTSIRMGRSMLSIHGNAVWIEIGPSSVQSFVASSGGKTSTVWSTGGAVLRRFIVGSAIKAIGTKTHGIDDTNTPAIRVDCEPSQIGDHTDTTNGIPGSTVGHLHISRTNPEPQAQSGFEISATNNAQRHDHEESASENLRQTGGVGRSYETCKTNRSTSTIHSKTSAHKVGSACSCSQQVRISSTGTQTVVTEGPNDRLRIESDNAVATGTHGSRRQRTRRRSMDRTARSMHTRVETRVETREDRLGPTISTDRNDCHGEGYLLGKHDTATNSDSSEGAHGFGDSTSEIQESDGRRVGSTVANPDSHHALAETTPGCPPIGTMDTGRRQRSGRRIVEGTRPRQLEIAQIGVQTDQGQTGASGNRPIQHSAEPPVTEVCQQIPSSRSDVVGCVLTDVDKFGGVICQPTVESDSGHVTEDSGRQSSVNGSSTGVENGNMVAATDGIEAVEDGQTTATQGPVHASMDDPGMDTESTPVENGSTTDRSIMRRKHTKEQLEKELQTPIQDGEEALALLRSYGVKDSTIRILEVAWSDQYRRNLIQDFQKFEAWCEDEDVSPEDEISLTEWASSVATTLDVSEETLTHVRTLWRLMFAEDAVALVWQRIMRAKRITRMAIPRKEQPFWVPEQIFRHILTLQPPQTDTLARMHGSKYMSWLRRRAAVLVALDTFSRGGGLAYLSREEEHLQFIEVQGQRPWVDLHFVEDKTRLLRIAAPTVHAVRIHCSCDLCVGACSYCTLKVYVNITKLHSITPRKMRSGRSVKPVFVSLNFKEGARYPLAPGTTGRIVAETLQAAIGKPVTAHSVRSMCSTAAFSRGVALATVVQRGRWSTTDTWQKHYSRLPQSTCAIRPLPGPTVEHILRHHLKFHEEQ